jgi:hypothetical protein
MRAKARQVGFLAISVVLFAVCASLAHAELTARGDLFVRFGGGISPNALPRDARAPISIRIVGTVKTLSGARPPALRQISIAINQGGRLDAQGLPTCRQSELEPSSSAEALARCGPALVGGGSYDADIAFPEQSAFPSHGRILAFNAIVNGKRAILAQIYGARPVPITRVIVFHIRERLGTFGTVLTGALPEKLNRWGYLNRISLELHRDFTYRGQARSYLSAACDAPVGFPGATFPFAHASMSFADGRTLSSTLTRSCKVRD